MDSNTDLPIALRRSRRSSSGLRLSTSAVQTSTPKHSPAPAPPSLPTPSNSISSSPRRRGRPRKSVRFSDPGTAGEKLLAGESTSSTGLTPLVRRTSLAAPRRRHSTPAKPSSLSLGSSRGSWSSLDSCSSPYGGDVTVVPLRQVLDGRVKRRIRRNGLSEEMNTIHAEKKRRAAEIQRLKDDLAFKDAEILRLRETQQRLRTFHGQEQQQPRSFDADETVDTVVGDTERIFGLECEVAELRRKLSGRASRAAASDAGDHTQQHEWTLAAKDPFSPEDYSMVDVGSFPADHTPSSDGEDDGDDFGDFTMADMQCSTPCRPARREASVSGAGSFPTPPATSPLASTAPVTPKLIRFPPPRSQTTYGVQADMPDPEKQVLEEELASLQLEVAKMTTRLKSYQSLAGRVSEQLTTFTPTAPAMTNSDAVAATAAANPSSPDPALETHLAALLTTVSDRSAALLDLTSSLKNLGFPGADAGEIVTSLASAFRTARLELEYLTPGEVALPLTSAGAAVLDLLLTRLRDLSKRTREDEGTIDEYHAQELSLRQQLAARVDAADEANREVASLKADLAARDGTVTELQLGLDRLKGAAASYARDVDELEKLVERLETQRLAALEECELRLNDAARTSEDKLAAATAARDAAVGVLEARLAAALAEAADLRTALAAAARERADEVHSLNASHGRQLALRDARVAELRAEVERVGEALREAHDTAARLRADAARLEGRLEDEQDAAVAAVDAMKAQLERVVAMGQQFLAASTPRASPRSAPGSVAKRTGAEGASAAAAVRPGGLFDAGKARRRSGSSSPSPVDEAAAVSSPSAAPKPSKRRRYDSGLGFLDEEEVNV